MEKRVKLHVKKGDLVVVLSGDDKGKRGHVLRSFPSTGKVIVENVNMIKKHQRPNRISPQGGIFEREAPFPASKVKLVNPKTNNVTRAVYKLIGDKRVRVDGKTGDEI